MNKEEFFEEMFNRKGKSTINSTVYSFTEEKAIKSVNLIDILNLNRNNFSQEALYIIDTLENDEGFPYFDLYQKMKWKILSLTNVQDVFEGIIFKEYTIETFSAKSYFYYEGLYLLREYFYCGFNNYLSASQHLLRTFIEFNIKQNYFNAICKSQNSFLPLTKYLKTGISPSNIKMINAYLPDDNFTKPVKKKIQVILKNLSNTSSHAYKPIDSNRGAGKLRHEYSIDTTLFWLTLNHTLNAVLWSYYLSYPNLFIPKDIVRRFGYNFPMGAFVSNFQYNSIKNAMEVDDFILFEEYSKKSDLVESLEEFYESQKELTDREILLSWKEGKDPPRDINEGYVRAVAENRAMCEMLASNCTFEAQSNVDENVEKLILDITSYDWWKKNYKKI